MKKFNWKQWTAVGITAALIITAVILHFVQPAVSYALLEFTSIGTFILGGVSGWLIKNKKDNN